MQNDSLKKLLHLGVIDIFPYVSDCAFDKHCFARGLGVDAAKLACDHLGVDCRFERYNSRDYGTCSKNNGGLINCTGLTGEIFNGHYDTSIPVFASTYDRSLGIDFSKIFFQSNIVLATRMPSPTRRLNESLLNSFQWQVWAGIAATICVCPILYWGSTKIHSSINGASNLGVRLITLVWLILATIVFGAYNGATISGNISAFLDYPFTDLESFVQCVENDQCRFITETGTSTLQTFINGTSEFSGRLRKVMTRNSAGLPFLIEVPIGQKASRILAEQKIFLVSASTKASFLAMSLKNADCNFYMIAPEIMPEYQSFLFSKKSPLISEFDRVANYFMQFGFDKAIVTRNDLINRCQNRLINRNDLKPLAIEALYELFVIYGCCIFLSFLALLYEVYRGNGAFFRRNRGQVCRVIYDSVIEKVSGIVEKVKFS